MHFTDSVSPEEMVKFAQVIDPTDPIMAHFAIQHDLRERFHHALTEIIDAVSAWSRSETSDDPDVEIARSLALIEQMTTIATEAVAPDRIREWFEDDRPLPWLDEQLGSLPDDLSRVVAKMIGLEDGNIS